MTDSAQPLNTRTPISNPDGTPTDFLIRWAKQFSANAVPIDGIGAGTGIAVGAGPVVSLDAVLDDLNDVDTTTISPTNGQALVYDNVSGLWKPATIAAGGKWWAGHVPLATDFPNNQSGDAVNTSVSDDTDLGLKVSFGAMVSSRFRVRSKDLPSLGATDWQITARVAIEPVPGQVLSVGVGLLESSTAKYSCLELLTNGTGATNHRSERGTLTAFGATLGTGNQSGIVPFWVRVIYTHSSTSFQYQLSYNGKDFTNFGGAITNATCFTTRADKVGFVVINGATTSNIPILYCDYWVQSW